MANITNFKISGDDRTITKVRVSLDDGATWGMLYEGLKRRNLKLFGTEVITNDYGILVLDIMIEYDGPAISLDTNMITKHPLYPLPDNATLSYEIIDNYTFRLTCINNSDVLILSGDISIIVILPQSDGYYQTDIPISIDYEVRPKRGEASLVPNWTYFEELPATITFHCPYYPDASLMEAYVEQCPYQCTASISYPTFNNIIDYTKLIVTLDLKGNDYAPEMGGSAIDERLGVVAQIADNTKASWNDYIWIEPPRHVGIRIIGCYPTLLPNKDEYNNYWEVEIEYVYKCNYGPDDTTIYREIQYPVVSVEDNYVYITVTSQDGYGYTDSIEFENI